MGMLKDAQVVYDGDILIYLSGFVAPILNIIGCMWGGYYCYGTAALFLVVMPVGNTIEFILRKFIGLQKDQTDPGLSVKQHNPRPPHLVLLWLFFPVYAFALLYSAKVFGSLPTTWEKFALLNSTGTTGLFGLAVIHELAHKREKISQALSVVGAGMNINPNFVFDHFSVHHAQAATHKDPQTALLG